MRTDLTFTLRALRHAPWYSATVVGVIAVTLALATTVFAVVDGVLFRPLPYPDADRLVKIQPSFRSVPPPPPVLGEVPIYGVSPIDLANWRAAAPDVNITGFRAQGWSGFGAGVNDDAAGVGSIQPNFFDVVGVQPLIGGFAAADFIQDTRVRPVILMYDTWQSRLGGAGDVIGRVINVDPATGWGLRIAGVMPKGFSFPSVRLTIAFLTPLVVEPAAANDPKNRRFSEVVAHVPQGTTPALLAHRLEPGLAMTAAQFPLGPRPNGWSENGWRRQGPYDAVDVTPLGKSLGSRSRAMFLAVFAAVALLVLIGAANVSSLMTSRALERDRELQMRRVLGAGPAAIARLWTVEALTLVSIGAALGVLAAPPLLNLFIALLPDEVVLLKAARLDWRAAGFVAATMACLCVVVSIAPIRRSLRPAAGAVKGGTSDRARTPARFIVVGGQIAAAFVLTVVGACLVGSLLAVYGTDRPIRTDGIVVLEGLFRGPGGEIGTARERQVRGERIAERLKQAPGVTGVTFASAQLLSGGGWGAPFRAPDGRYLMRDGDIWAAMPGFYDILGLAAIEGRVHTDAELRSDARLVVVSERIARAYWPDGPAVGQTLRYSPPLRSPYTNESFTVIGVVPEVPWFAWDTESPMYYAPYEFGQSSPLTFLVRTDGRTGRAIDESIRAVADAAPEVRLKRAVALTTLYRDSISLRRFQSWLFGGFAAAALAVVGVGILGLLAMSTARRTKEIGIRCALGATQRSVTRLLVGEQLAPVLAGLVVGGAVAAWAVSLVKGYVYQLSVADPRIWGAAVTLIVVTAGLGALLPALRASRIDPVKALRAE